MQPHHILKIPAIASRPTTVTVWTPWGAQIVTLASLAAKRRRGEAQSDRNSPDHGKQQIRR